MGNYANFLMFENPRRGRQARNFTENDPKILDLKSSSEQIIFRKLSLGAPESRVRRSKFLASRKNSSCTVACGRSLKNPGTNQQKPEKSADSCV